MEAYSLFLYPLSAPVACCVWQLVAGCWKWWMRRWPWFSRLHPDSRLGWDTCPCFVLYAPLLGIPVGITCILIYQTLPPLWFWDPSGDLPGDSQLYSSLLPTAAITAVLAEFCSARRALNMDVQQGRIDVLSRYALGPGRLMLWAMMVTGLTAVSWLLLPVTLVLLLPR